MTETTNHRNRLATLLDTPSQEGLTMRSDEVQAFMLALLSGPDELNQEEWLPEILGDGEFSDEERLEVGELVLALAIEWRQHLEEGRMPELWVYPDDNGDDDWLVWCNAYLYALDVVPTDWFEAAGDDDFEDLFYPLMALAGLYDEDGADGSIITIDDKERVRLAAELPHTLQDIAAFWRVWCNKPKTVRRDEPKIGRNDPCRCGSGKKYKNCCG